MTTVMLIGGPRHGENVTVPDNVPLPVCVVVPAYLGVSLPPDEYVPMPGVTYHLVYLPAYAQQPGGPSFLRSAFYCIEDDPETAYELLTSGQRVGGRTPEWDIECVIVQLVNKKTGQRARGLPQKAYSAALDSAQYEAMLLESKLPLPADIAELRGVR